MSEYIRTTHAYAGHSYAHTSGESATSRKAWEVQRVFEPGAPFLECRPERRYLDVAGEKKRVVAVSKTTREEKSPPCSGSWCRSAPPW